MVVQAINRKQEAMSMFQKIGYLFKIIIRSFLIVVFILLSLLIVFGFIYFGDLLYNTVSGKEKNPLFNAYVVVTESMVPTIKVNDAIIVKRADEESIEIGDIITFSSTAAQYRGLTITHRVVGKQLSSGGEYIYRTKGDNNYLEDTALVNLDSVYGKVIFKIPKVGYVQKFVSSPSGFVISILVPVLLVIVYEVFRIVRLIKKRNEEIEIL